MPVSLPMLPRLPLLVVRWAQVLPRRHFGRALRAQVAITGLARAALQPRVALKLRRPVVVLVADVAFRAAAARAHDRAHAVDLEVIAAHQALGSLEHGPPWTSPPITLTMRTWCGQAMKVGVT